MKNGQVQIRFQTQLPAQFRVASTPFAVPAKLARSGLSEVVNHLLNLTPAQPFDFLLDGELLRTTLSEHLKLKGLTTETTLTLEYLLIPPKPTPQLDMPHDDWVSAVSGDVDGLVLTGSCDGKARVFKDTPVADIKEKAAPTLVLDGHTDAVTAVGWLSDRSSMLEALAVTGSKDFSLRGWEVKLEQQIATARWRFLGHTDSITSLSVANDREKFCSGSWDRSIKVWGTPSTTSLRDAEALSSQAKKKQKGQTQEPAADIKNRGPLATLIGHTQCVSSVHWGSSGQVFSGSFDHTIRVWDVEQEIAVSTLNGSKAVNGLTVTSDSKLIASAHGDRLIRVWDPRAAEGAVVTTALASHKGWVSSVAFLPRSDIYLASASYDHSVRLWDIRSTVAMHTLAGHIDKALCVGWASKNRVISGGADGKVRFYSPWREEGGHH